MPVVYNSFSPASSVILAMSSDEELVIAEAREEFETLAAFEHSGEELQIHVQCTSSMEEQILPEKR